MSENDSPSPEKAKKKPTAKKTPAKKSPPRTTKAKAAAEAKAASAAAVTALAGAPETAMADQPKTTKGTTRRKSPAKKTGTESAKADTAQPASSPKEETSSSSVQHVNIKPQGVTRISTPPRVRHEQRQNNQENERKDSSRNNAGKDNREQRSNRNARQDEHEHSPFSAPETVGGDSGMKRNKRRRNRNRSTKNESSHPAGGHEPLVDPYELSQKAWKIFLGEVNEDGLALMDDHSTREIAKKSFRVAEIFLQEELKRNQNRHASKPPETTEYRVEEHSPLYDEESVEISLSTVEEMEPHTEEMDEVIIPAPLDIDSLAD